MRRQVGGPGKNPSPPMRFCKRIRAMSSYTCGPPIYIIKCFGQLFICYLFIHFLSFFQFFIWLLSYDAITSINFGMYIGNWAYIPSFILHFNDLSDFTYCLLFNFVIFFIQVHDLSLYCFLFYLFPVLFFIKFHNLCFILLSYFFYQFAFFFIGKNVQHHILFP